MNVFPDAIDFGAATREEIEAYATEVQAQLRAVAAAPDDFVGDGYTTEQLLADARDARESLNAAKAALAATDAIVPVPDTDPAVTVDAAAELAALADAADDDPDPDDTTDADTTADADAPAPEATGDAATLADDAVTASTTPAPTPARRAPARSRQATPRPDEQTAGRLPVSLRAAAPIGHDVGDNISMLEVAEMMRRRRKDFGIVPPGTSGEKQTIARFTWEYPDGRRLTTDEAHNNAVVAAVVDQERITAEMRRRREGSLTASGGLCAPVTPYYQLANVSTAGRPVRDALPGFNADRGGIRYARPATLAEIDTAVGIISAADDAAGGTFATKACQVIECPPFDEVDVRAIYHCLQFGNLPARTFPELLAQYNNLTLAAQARLAESALLTDIGNFSTSITASDLGLGATAALSGQILAAVEGMRSRHRMDPDAVLRIMLPSWSVSMLISDLARSQWNRFTLDKAGVIALLRSWYVEPTFYIDGAEGAEQVFGAQTAGELLPFPDTVVSYIFPEGSFIYLDSGVLELGLVRDSVLNSTNDFQIFGESFENVAFVGVEALELTSSVCDTGITAGVNDDIVCPIDYSA